MEHPNPNQNQNLLPELWSNVLEDYPCFVINMDACVDRWKLCRSRISNAGFKDVRRFSGVDARDPVVLAGAWNQLGNPPFDPSDPEFVTYPGKQGCFLSHVFLYKKMMDEHIPYATILEDDILFHAKWKFLAPQYYQQTDKSVDLLYYGSQIDHMMHGHLLKTPVFCTHAYGITLKGARLLYDLLVHHPNGKGVRTIDCILKDEMVQHVFHKKEIPFHWQVWSGVPFPDPVAFQDPKWARRNTGLVFQDPSLGTYVREW